MSMSGTVRTVSSFRLKAWPKEPGVTGTAPPTHDRHRVQGQLSSVLLTQVASVPGALAMQSDPRYLRAQSEDSFRTGAPKMSLPADAQIFRLTAEEYKARAAALEARGSNGPAATEPEA